MLYATYCCITLNQDHQEPELQDYERGVAFIKRWHAKGGKVLVHCKAGHGRWDMSRHAHEKRMETQPRVGNGVVYPFCTTMPR